jgi:SAM-dependent methyltransferase
VDSGTVAVYQERAKEWRARRGDRGDGLGREFRAAVGEGLVADLGCGVGRYLPEIGTPVLGMDATPAMLAEAEDLTAAGGIRVPLVQGDLEALPFGNATLAGLFARHSYLHLSKVSFGGALAEARRVLVPDGLLLLSLIVGDYEGRGLPQDDFPGRLFALWSEVELGEALARAGFSHSVVELRERTGDRRPDLIGRARR